MRRTTGLIAAVVILANAAACSRDETPGTKPPPPDAKRVDGAKAGRLTGRVTIEGPVPQNAGVKMSGDPVCQRAHKDGATLQTFVSENGGLGNVFVYVKSGLEGYYFDTPSEAVTLDQKGCQYEPHVLGVQVGQNVEFVNSDATGHNVHVLPDVNTEFNFSQFIQTQRDSRFFTKPEVMVRVKCDMHNWMSAFVGVVEHPYFAVSRPAGDFELKNLPAGSYTVEAWHEQLGRQTQTVTLADNDAKQVTFIFKGPAATAP